MDLSRDFVFLLLETGEPFPVDFDEAWNWIGYSRKDAAKRVLETSFVRDIDYQIFAPQSGGAKRGGHNKESISLTVDCFKSFCMMAGTEKGREVRQYFIACEAELKRRVAEEGARQVIGAYTRRVSLGFQMPEPDGYFTVFHKSSHLLIYVEVELKMPINKFDLLDGSVGIRWARYRTGQDWAGERIPYSHVFPDHRDVQSAWAYPSSELPHFDKWLKATYIPQHLPVYLKDKYGAIVKV